MKCPGQDSRYWKPGAIFEAQCPKCGSEVEFFKDDTTRLCKQCGHRFLNPEMDFGCASYCKYAEQCIGSLTPELLEQRKDLLKDRVAVEMKRHAKNDFKKIGHATRVARYAEHICKEEGCDLAVALSAAYLHNTGSPVQQSDSGARGDDSSPEGSESSKTARNILSTLKAPEPMIDEVCDIILRLGEPHKEETGTFCAVFDAELIANMEERHKQAPLPREEMEGLIEGRLRTSGGRMLARSMFLSDDGT